MGAPCRRVRFAPYRKGMGPTFVLTLWDDGIWGRYPTGQERMRYRLTMTEGRKRTVLWDATDYGRAPGDASDSNACVEGIMGFLTLRPGDTDAEHFEGYTDAQRAFCEQHAETLSSEVHARFQCVECGAAVNGRGRYPRRCSYHAERKAS